jgi:hypothetical protein
MSTYVLGYHNTATYSYYYSNKSRDKVRTFTVMNTHVEQDWPPQDQVKDVEENEEEPDEEDPIVCFYPNLAEITRRQDKNEMCEGKGAYNEEEPDEEDPIVCSLSLTHLILILN